MHPKVQSIHRLLSKSSSRVGHLPRYHRRDEEARPPHSQPNFFKVQIPTLILMPLTLLFLTISSPKCTFHHPHSAQNKWSPLSPSILTVLTAHRLLFIALQFSWVLTQLTGPPTQGYLSVVNILIYSPFLLYYL